MALDTGFNFEILNLDAFQRAMTDGSAVAARGLWIGTRRSLGAMRRDFLESTKVNIRGRETKNRFGGTSRAKTRNLGSTFRWAVRPKYKGAAWAGSRKFQDWSQLNLTDVNKIEGWFFTGSEAAEGLELGPTITSKGAWIGIPIALEGKPNAAKRQKGQQQSRAKPTWRTVKKMFDKYGRQYDFKFSPRAGHTLLYAKKKRPKDSIPFPVMLLVRKVQMKRGQLGFYDFADKYTPGIIRRFNESLEEAMKEVAKRANKR